MRLSYSSPRFIGLAGLMRKEIGRIFRIWIQTFVPPAITSALYFVVFGHVIGRHISAHFGVSYMQFISPGLIMMAVITSSYANVVGSFYIARINGSIQDLLVSPMSHLQIILGYVLSGAFRGVAVGLIVTMVSVFFVGFHIQHIFLSLFILILCSVLFALGGLLNAIYARKIDDTTVVSNFILTPMIYLGGVFYNINMLSPFWYHVSLLNPIHYLISLYRFAMLNILTVPVMLALGVVIAMIVGLFLLTMHCINRGYGLKN